MAPNLNSSDFYEVLGVPRGCNDSALKKAYKKLAVKVSHDVNGETTHLDTFSLGRVVVVCVRVQ
jgi:curved DNA-binding protein CbpA